MPKLFLIRHAIAEDREVFKKAGLPDSERPLTSHGKTRMKKVAKKLHTLYPEIQTFLQSPLTRAQQTTQILRNFYSQSVTQTISELKPSTTPEKILPILKYYEGKTLAIVGHEPYLSHLLQYLLTGQTTSVPLAPLKKGGIACLDNSNPGKMQLLWLATPKTWV